MQSRTDPSRSELSRAAPNRSESLRIEPSHSEPSRAASSRTEPAAQRGAQAAPWRRPAAWRRARFLGASERVGGSLRSSGGQSPSCSRLKYRQGPQSCWGAEAAKGARKQSGNLPVSQAGSHSPPLTQSLHTPRSLGRGIREGLYVPLSSLLVSLHQF